MKYDILKNWHKSNNPYNWEKGCSFCKKPFGEDEKFTRIDVMEGIFRGDDEVFCFHKNCWSEQNLLTLIKNSK